MCEIVTVDADYVADDPQSFVKAMMETIYQTNNDGLGFVVTSIDEETGTFEHSGFKGGGGDHDADPFVEWLEDEAEGAWRVTAHARLATAGGVGFEQTHPISIVDEDVDAKYVIHNGVVHGAQRHRNRLKSDGHTFNTTVDSEVIAHSYADIPTDIDDLEQASLYGRLNWLLYSKDAILVRNDGKYMLDDNMFMTCKKNWASDSMKDGDIGSGYALYTPTEDGDVEVQTTELENTVTTVATTASGSRTAVGRRRASKQWSKRARQSSNRFTDDSGNSNADTTTSSTETNTSTSGSEPIEDKIQRKDKATSSSMTVYDKNGYPWTPIAMADFGTDDVGQMLYARDDDNEGYHIEIDSVAARDGGERPVVRVYRDDGPVKGTKVLVKHMANSREDEWDSEGIYELGDKSSLLLEEIDHNAYITASVIMFPDGSKADFGDDDTSGIEPEEDGTADITTSEAKDVSYWHHYSVKTRHTNKDGYCSLHTDEFSGRRCEQCLEHFTRDELLDTETDLYPKV